MKRPLLVSLLVLLGCATATPKPEASPAPEAKPVDREAWRTQPAPQKPSPLVVPKFERAVLPNGLTVLVSQERSLPLIALGVATGAGTAADPLGKAGLASLTYDMLLQGAGPYDAVALDEAFAQLGSSAFSSTQPDGAIVGVRVLSSNAEAAVNLLRTVVRSPRFDKAEFAREKRQRLASLTGALARPDYLLRLAAGETLYGAQHPYGHPGSGTPQSVESLTVEEARAFHKKWVGPKNAVFIATGDITLQGAVALATKAFGDWRSPATRPPAPPDPAPSAGRLVLVPKEGLTQTMIMVGRPAVSAKSEEVAPLELAATVVGGFFGSRLNMNLRETKGYSYGASAYLDARRGQGTALAMSQVRADVTGPAFKEMVGELEGLKTRPITAEELEAAREGLIQSIPGSFSTIEELLETAAGLYWEERPLDDYARFIDALLKATPAQVQASAEKYFNPQGISVVMVGDAPTVERQVGPLVAGKIETQPPPRPPAAPAGASGAP